MCTTTTTTGRSLLLVCLGLMVNLTIAQPTRYFFEHLTTKEGLSQNDINCILQDQTGFMWFGTNDGLNLYDGYEFTTFKPKEGDSSSLISNLIQGLVEDHLGRIWIGTAGEGLSCYLPRYNRFVNLNTLHGDFPELPSNFVVSLHIDSNHRLWVGTSKGLCLLQLSDTYEVKAHSIQDISLQFLPERLQQDRINEVFESDKKEIWVGANSGLYHLRQGGSTQQEFQTYRVNRQYTKGICQGKFGELLVGTGGGLFSLTTPTFGKYTLTKVDQQTHDVLHYLDGTLWTSSPLGLSKFIYPAGSSHPVKENVYTSDLSDLHSLNKTVLRTLYADRNGIIWIGTNGGGINKFEPRQKTFSHYKETLTEGSISYDKIRSLYEDSEQNLWIGTEGGGLNFHPATDSGESLYTNFSHIPSPANVFAISEYQCEGERFLLLGGQSRPGLHSIPLTENMGSLSEITPIPIPEITSSVFAILNIDDCDIWVGTYHNGLFRMDTRDRMVTGQFRYRPDLPNTLSSDLIRSLIRDQEGNIWIGTGNGLNMLAVEDQESDHPSFTNYLHDAEDPMSISHNYVLALFQSKDGAIWVGTFGGGLNKFVPASKGRAAHFVSFTEEDGLPNNVVKGILEDDEGFLWLSTNKGLTRFNPKTEIFYNFDIRDGLQSDEFSELAQLKRRNGDMLFGGVNGFNVFKTSSIHLNPNPPQVALTDFQVLNKAVGAGDLFNGRILLDQALISTSEIHLKHHENSFSLGFSAFHYRAPVKNKYAYKLEGLHTDWIHVGADKRFVNFTNLDPGTYVFKVMASNSDGIWNESPTQVTIHIAPPFWLTWWAFLIYAALTVGIIWVLAHYTFIGTREKHQLILERLEKEKNEELQQMKLQFFTNISHELRTPLSLISGPMDFLIQSGRGLSDEVREKQYQLIKKNAEYLLRLANQLLDFRKVDQGIVKLKVQQEDMVAYIKEVSEPFQFIAEKKGIAFEVEASSPNISAWFDPGVVEKVVYNLLSNAFKYTPEGGNVNVEITYPTENRGKLKPKHRQKCVEIRVQDTGVGIPKKDRQKVFYRFFKSEPGNGSNPMGAGIGLSYTKELVKLHHGSIWVEENQAGGACFVVKLPAQGNAYTSHEKATTYKSSQQERFASPPMGMNRTFLESALYTQGNQQVAGWDSDKTRVEAERLPKMLIIDDNEDIRTFLREAFRSEYTIYEAPNGAEGLKIALEHTPNLILSDVMMPEMDGIELCNALKEDMRTSHIPILLLTAKTTEETELEGLRMGADGYIRKPFRIEILRHKVANILATRQEFQKRFRREEMLEPTEIDVSSNEEPFLQKAMNVIEENMTEPDFNVEAMVREIGMSRSKLYLKLKGLTGLSSSEFIRTVRLKRAAQLLETSDLTIKEIMFLTGFNTASYFSKCFKKQFGVVPSEYMQQKNTVKATQVEPVIFKGETLR